MPHSIDGFKTCTKCKINKPLSDFFKNKESKSDGVMSRCKKCKSEQAAEWAISNRERRNAMKRAAALKPERVAVSKKWEDRERRSRNAAARERHKSPEYKAAQAEYQKSYRLINNGSQYKQTDKYKLSRRIYSRSDYAKERARAESKRRLSTPRGNINNRMSSAIWHAVKKNNRSWVSLAGYTLDQLMTHLEKQFLKGMGWHNFGEWHIDHIIAKSTFTYTCAEDAEFKECWSLSNLRPLWAKDNLQKQAKQIYLL